MVKQGYEPLNFTGWFQAWDPNFWGKVNHENNKSSNINVNDETF